jgi:hypothetical protein
MVKLKKKKTKEKETLVGGTRVSAGSPWRRICRYYPA